MHVTVCVCVEDHLNLKYDVAKRADKPKRQLESLDKPPTQKARNQIVFKSFAFCLGFVSITEPEKLYMYTCVLSSSSTTNTQAHTHKHSN